MSKTFTAVKGSHITDSQAQIIGEETELLLESEGQVTARRIVDVAVAGDSRLHDFFDWDDETAADAHRLDQARYLMRSIEVYYALEETEEAKPIKAMYSVIDDEQGRIYVPLDAVIADTGYREQVIEKALNKMRGWACKYRQYKELRTVIDAIDKM